MKIWCVDEGVACVQEGWKPSLMELRQVLTRWAFPFVLEGQEMGVTISVNEGLAR